MTRLGELFGDKMQTGYGEPKPNMKTDRIREKDKILVYWDTPTQTNRVFGVFSDGWVALREFKGGAWNLPNPAIGGADKNGLYESIEDVLLAIDRHIPQRN